MPTLATLCITGKLDYIPQLMQVEWMSIGTYLTLPFGTRIYLQNTLEHENNGMKSRFDKLERDHQDLKQTIAKMETKSKGIS